MGSVFWKHDHEDVARCDVVLVYAEPTDVLKGALVEAGIGIALNKTIIVVGDNEGYSTWQYHSLVKRVADLNEAEELLKLLTL